MNLQKQQDFLARLFTDESLRRNFLNDAKKIGVENGLTESDIAALENVLPEQLDFFADSLFWKRLREAEKFLPETKNNLKENFTNLFREFSRNFNPQTVKKHLEDAHRFCEFLLKKPDLNSDLKTVIKFEKSKLEFFGFEKRIVICRFPKTFQSTDKPKRLSVWLRFNGKIHHFTF